MHIRYTLIASAVASAALAAPAEPDSYATPSEPAGYGPSTTRSIIPPTTTSFVPSYGPSTTRSRIPTTTTSFLPGYGPSSSSSDSLPAGYGPSSSSSSLLWASPSGSSSSASSASGVSYDGVSSSAPWAYGSSSSSSAYVSSSSGFSHSASSSAPYGYPSPGSSSSYRVSSSYSSRVGPWSSSASFSASSTISSPPPSGSPNCWGVCFGKFGISSEADLCDNSDVSACIHETCDAAEDKKYWAWYTSYCSPTTVTTTTCLKTSVTSTFTSYVPCSTDACTETTETLTITSVYETTETSTYVTVVPTPTGADDGSWWHGAWPPADGSGGGDSLPSGGSGSSDDGNPASPVDGGSGSSGDGSSPPSSPIGGGEGYPTDPSGGACPVCPTCPATKTASEYCLSDEDAEQAADIFRQLIQEYSDEVALIALTEDFVDYSSAVNIIINGGDGEPIDIEKPTFVGRDEFMAAQGSQPEIPFKKLQRFHGCNSVSMRWLTRRSANGQPTESARIPVVGNVIIETVPSSPGDEYNFRIKTIFSEFNSAAWLVNLGVFVPENGTEGDAGNKRSLPTNLRGAMF